MSEKQIRNIIWKWKRLDFLLFHYLLCIFLNSFPQLTVWTGSSFWRRWPFSFSPGSRRRRRRLNTNKAVSNAAAAATSFLHRLQNFKFVASQANPENCKKIEKFLTGTFWKKTPFFAPKMTRLAMESVLEKFKFCWSCRELINTSANCLISNWIHWGNHTPT